MFRNSKIQEKLLYEIWKEKKFSRSVRTIDDQKVEIIDVGEHNKDSAGPDFLNTRIKIGNITYLGDVEIDTWHSDWKAHGHNLDKKYNKVILHIVLSKEKYQSHVYTQDGRKVTSLCLTDFLEDSYSNSIKKAIVSERKYRLFVMPCTELNGGITEKGKMKLLAGLGIERFKEKEKKIFKRLKEIVYLKEMNIREPIVRYDFGEEFYSKKFSQEEFNDPAAWQQLVYELIFEALGYSKNKDIMLRMAKAVNIDFITQFAEQKNFSNYIESALFNVSGLLPGNHSGLGEDSSEYLRDIVGLWAEIKNKYDGPLFSEDKWHFFKLRPQNFPTVRLAGGSKILKRLIINNFLKKIIDAFINGTNQKKLASSLRNLLIVKAEGFWKKHYVFKKSAREEIKYFVGLSRADEIIINVILPVTAVYFDIFSNKQAARKVKNLFLNYSQKSTNQVVHQVEESLKLKKIELKSVYYQGMVELFRHFCVKEKCLECEIGKIIFN